MDFGRLLGQMVQQGLSGSTQGRLQNAMGRSGLGGGQGGGDLMSSLGAMAQQFLGGGTGGIGGIGGAKAGGLGALAGALFGGGGGAVKGAIGGGALAVLGNIALQALSQRGGGATAQPGLAEAPSAFEPDMSAMAQLTSPESAQLVVRAMINAAKADGKVGEAEMERIVGKLDEDGDVSREERMFVLEEMRRPLDLAGLVSEVPDRKVAAQVYAASLLAIEVDTEAERSYLADLQQRLGLDDGTVRRLHEMTGANA